MSPIEQSIKAKIEKIGTPLKDWDINIYRGVLTGFNDAFIISGDKRKEILAKCKSENERKRTDDLIRPILRGRDIKRYEYNFADLYLINTHNGVKDKNIPRINIKDYPAIKKHLDEYWDKISTRADKGDTPYNLRNCAYMDEFNKPKIVYPDIMRLPRDIAKMGKYPYFYYDEKGFYPEATVFIMTGEKIKSIFNFLCSEIGFFVFSKYYMGPVFDSTGFRYKKEYLMELPIPKLDENLSSTKYEATLSKVLNLTREELEYINSYKSKLLQ